MPRIKPGPPQAGPLQLALVACVILFAACGTKVALLVGPDVGMLAPPFTLTDTDGRSVSLADYADNPKALIFYRVLSWTLVTALH